MANIPNTNCGYCIAPQPFTFFLADKYENKTPPNITNNAPESQSILFCSKGTFNAITSASF